MACRVMSDVSFSQLFISSCFLVWSEYNSTFNSCFLQNIGYFPKVTLKSIAGKSRVETGRPSSGSPLSMDLEVIIPDQVVSGYNLDLNGWAREI